MASLVLFAFVLIIAGGVIAWLGDWLGTRIGKKRLSVFGLRPRHTATLLTIASGVGIALVSLATLISYDYGVRRALLHGQEIIHSNKVLKRQSVAQQQKIAAGQTLLEAEQAKLASAEAKLQPVQGQLNGARVSLAATRAELLTAQRQVGAAKVSLRQAQAQVTAAQGQVQHLSQERLALATLNDGLRRQRLALAARATASQETLIYRTGQEIARRVIRTSQPVAAVERQLLAFLTELSEQAARKRGKLGVNGRAVAIAVPIRLPKPVLAVSTTKGRPASVSTAPGDLRALSPAEEKRAVRVLAQNISEARRGTGSVVVVAQVAFNAFKGEQSDIILKPYANVLIYHRDAVVASETIDGRQSEIEVLSSLQSFLTRRVRPAALREGVIPQTDPQTGRPLVGAIDDNTTRALVRQIAQSKGPVRVTAQASEDIYSVGPLRLRLTALPMGAL